MGGQIVGALADVDLMSVLNEMVALVPKVIPVIVGCIAFRKGLQFLKSAIKSA